MSGNNNHFSSVRNVSPQSYEANQKILIGHMTSPGQPPFQLQQSPAQYQLVCTSDTNFSSSALGTGRVFFAVTQPGTAFTPYTGRNGASEPANEAYKSGSGMQRWSSDVSASGLADEHGYHDAGPCSTVEEDEGEEVRSLLCSETFTSPTPPSDDSGFTHTANTVVWPQSDISSSNQTLQAWQLTPNKQTVFTGNGTADNTHVQALLQCPRSNATNCTDTTGGYLLKAALLSGSTQHAEAPVKDINSNFHNFTTKCKLCGNECASECRMSGSGDGTRMTGSGAGGASTSVTRLSDGSVGAQVAAAEGMIVGRVAGTGAVHHDVNARSIVTGSVGAGSQGTAGGAVFRSPHSLAESTSRYGQPPYTTASTYSPLHSGTSHTAGLTPYAAFYSQYPNYGSSVMTGTIDPQFGSYSAVLQSIGSHAAQSQVPRSPYGGAAGVLTPYSLSPMAQTSPGGKVYPGTPSLDEIRYKQREQESDTHRRFSTGVLKDDKIHQFSVPSGFTEPGRTSYSSSLRESPSHKRGGDLPASDFYKIPTGREGSLKHRILRPSDSTSTFSSDNTHSSFISKNTDEPAPKRAKLDHLDMSKSTRTTEPSSSSTSASGEVVSVSGGPSGPPGRSSHLHYPHHFMKGSIIQLGNGEYKRVEELVTEDFIHSANVSSDLKVDSSTVVQIDENETQGTAVLGFVVGEHKVQVTVEATVEHPFFVFGQGWSSCEPAWTMKRYGLDCQKLNVGDVCISLTHKEVTAHAAEISKQQKQKQLEGYSARYDKISNNGKHSMNKDIKLEPIDSPMHGSPNSRNKSPGNRHSPAVVTSGGTQQSGGLAYRSDTGHNAGLESSTAAEKGERLFSSPVMTTSQIPSCQSQEPVSVPATQP